MKNTGKFALLILLSALGILLGVAVGSTYISFGEQLSALGNYLFGAPLPEGVSANTASIVTGMRLPRALMAFVVGASLAASGTVMQSVLRNPLASSYTLGVSSGASLMAAAVIVSGVSWFGRYTVPLAGFAGGLVTVFAAMAVALRFDHNLENQTVILVGMVLSLFVNALLTLVTSMAGDRLAHLIFWQMGSFAGQPIQNAGMQAAVLAASLLALEHYALEMDIMTFGEEQALAAGVDIKRVKLILIAISALLTGTAVSMVGVIGFVDLIAPHVMRRFFGANHRVIVPASALFGGLLMVIADMIGRTVISPRDMPVGAVTALIGAPFFAYIYFYKKRGETGAGGAVAQLGARLRRVLRGNGGR